MVTIFGWSIEQVAIVAGRNKSLPPPSFDGLCELRRWWLLNNWPEPGTVEIIGVKPEKNYEWASKAFNSAIDEISRKMK